MVPKSDWPGADMREEINSSLGLIFTSVGMTSGQGIIKVVVVLAVATFFERFLK